MHVNTSQCSEVVKRHSWVSRTYSSGKLPWVKWFVCYGHCSFFPMMLGWLNYHDCHFPYHLIFTAEQPGKQCGEDLALSFAHTHTNTHSFYLIWTKPTAAFKCRSYPKSMSYRSTHTPRIKAYCWKEKQNWIFSLGKKYILHSPSEKDKLIMDQVLWSNTHRFELFSKERETHSPRMTKIEPHHLHSHCISIHGAYFCQLVNTRKMPKNA